MTTYYYNNQPIQTPFSVVSNERAYTTETINLKTKKLKLPAQRWELTFNVIANSSEADLIISHTQDFNNVDTMIMPQLIEVQQRKTVSGVGIFTNGAHSAGATTVSFSCPNDGVIPKGTFIQITNGTKIYMVTSDATFTDNNPVDVNIYPALVKDTPSGTNTWHGHNAMFRFYRDTSMQSGITYQNGILINPGKIKLIEKI